MVRFRRGPKNEDGSSSRMDKKSDLSYKEATHSAPNTTDLSAYQVKKVILATHAITLLSSTAFFVQIATLPYLTRKLGASPLVYGYLQTTYSILQLAGGPLFGMFSDYFGGQAAMALYLSSAASMYLILSTANGVLLLFLSRLPSIFMQHMQAGQMIVTDVSNTTSRTNALGKLGMTFGIGLIIGPLMGGAITKMYSGQFAAFIAFVISMLNMLLVLKFIPTRTKVFLKNNHHKEKLSSAFSLSKFIALTLNTKVFYILLFKTATEIPTMVFQSMFPVIALHQFHLAAHQNGLVLAYIGFLSMIVRGIGVSYVTTRFNENRILKWSVVLRIFAYLILTQTTDVWQFCLLCAPILVASTASADVVLTSILTKRVSKADTGAILGINSATSSLVRAFSPTIGGLMLSNFGFSSFGVLGTVIFTTASITFVMFKDIGLSYCEVR